MTDLETISLGGTADEQGENGGHAGLRIEHEYRPARDTPRARNAVGTREHEEFGAYLDD